MRVLLAGEWNTPMYEEACSKALERLGCTVCSFKWDHYFSGLIGKFQHKYSISGPAILRLNYDLISKALEEKPDVVLIWLGSPIRYQALRRIKKEAKAVMVSYIHDDPFSHRSTHNVPRHSAAHWRLYENCLRTYDIQFYSKQLNVDEATNLGAQHAHVLMQYYVPELHHPRQLTEQDLKRFCCDVVFVGHYEPDGREQYLRALVKAGVKVKLFGDRYWTRGVLGEMADYFGEVRHAIGDNYAKALCGATMCLNFLSHMNRDSYTTRCFEIPACGRLLLSQRTEPLQRMFKEDMEAVFFSSPDELLEKALWLLDHPDEIDRIAQAGMRRVHNDGHSVDDRMKEFLKNINEYHSC